uniref:SRS domain-containing protein n=1 Tax=Sarcocystis aucheniae TaxID=65407 RepID=A0A5P9S3P7_9APIC|nr:hypothetical protein [Sarcocystis aucheniae]
MMRPLLWRAVSCLFLAPIYVTAETPAIATCHVAHNGTAPVEVHKMRGMGTLRIECPAGTVTTNPATEDISTGGLALIHAEDIQSRHTLLQDSLPGATYVTVYVPDEPLMRHGDLTVRQMPTKETTIFFKCGASGNTACWIGIQVAAQNPLGPQGCVVDGSEINLQVTAADQEAQFVCGDGKKLLPEGDDAFEEDCTRQIPLSSALPGATLIRGEEPGTMNVFSVTELPKEAKIVCYVCAAAASAIPAERCFIRIQVSSRAYVPKASAKVAVRGFVTQKIGTPATTTTTSGSRMESGMTARIASALGILLAGTVF